METRWALYLALAVVAVVPAQGRRLPRSMAVSNAADGELLDSLQNGSGSFGESTKEKSHAGHSKGKGKVDEQSMTDLLGREYPLFSNSWSAKSESRNPRRSTRNGPRPEDDGQLKDAFAAMDTLEFEQDSSHRAKCPRLSTEDGSGDEVDPNELEKSELENSREDVETRSADKILEDLEKIITNKHPGHVPAKHVKDYPEKSLLTGRRRKLMEATTLPQSVSGNFGHLNEERSVGMDNLNYRESSKETKLSGAKKVPQEIEPLLPHHDPNLSLPFKTFESGDRDVEVPKLEFGHFRRSPKHTSSEPPERKFDKRVWKLPPSTFHNSHDEVFNVGKADAVYRRRDLKSFNEDNSLTCDVEREGSACLLKEYAPYKIHRKVLNKLLKEEFSAYLKKRASNHENMRASQTNSERRSGLEAIRDLKQKINIVETLLDSREVLVERLRERVNFQIKKIEDILIEPTREMLEREHKENFQTLLKHKGITAEELKRILSARKRHELDKSTLEIKSFKNGHRRGVELPNEPQFEMMAAYMGDSKNERPLAAREQPENLNIRSSRRKSNFRSSTRRETEYPSNGDPLSKGNNKGSYPVYSFLKQFSKLCKAKDRFYGFKEEKYGKDKFKQTEKTVSENEQCDEESFIEQLLLSEFNETCSSPRGSMISKLVKARIYSILENRFSELKPTIELVMKLALHVAEHSDLDKVTRTEKLLFYQRYLEAVLRLLESSFASPFDLPAETFLEELLKSTGEEPLKTDLQRFGYDVSKNSNTSDQISSMMSVMVAMVNAVMSAIGKNTRLNSILLEEPVLSRKLIKSMLTEELFARSVSKEFFAQNIPGKLRENSRTLEETSVGSAPNDYEEPKPNNDNRGPRFLSFSEANQRLWEENILLGEGIEEESFQSPPEEEKMLGLHFTQTTPLTDLSGKHSASFWRLLFSNVGKSHVESDVAREDAVHELNARTSGDIDETASEEKCHNRDLMLCGKPALAKLQKEKDMKQRCRVREEFLTCMSKQRTKGCASAAIDAGTGNVEDSPDITMLRGELRKNFHNCVLSYTIPDQSLGL